MLDILRKYRFFANLKIYLFYKNKVYFFSYVVLGQKVRINDK